MILDAFTPRKPGYYAGTMAGLSACAGVAGALYDYIQVGNLDEALVVGLSVALAEAVVAGTIALWADGGMRMYYMAHLAKTDDLPAPPPSSGFVAMAQPVFASDVEMAYQPGMAFVPMERGQVAALHVTETQLKELKTRIRSNHLGLPINGMETFSSVQVRKLRGEALYHRLAQERGSMVEWTGEGAVCVLRASPAPLVSVR